MDSLKLKDSNLSLRAIAHIENALPEKFGIPRQSGLVDTLPSRIIFEPEYRNPDYIRGIEQYSHLWLLWHFSENPRDKWSPTVRPPRLGGNKRLGLFATRSPFRPNPIGLSSVKLLEVQWDQEEGPVLIISGADLMDGTPIFDIKPYLPYTDSHPDAAGGFSEEGLKHRLHVKEDEVFFSQLKDFTPEEIKHIKELLSLDPRPSYQNDPERIYGMKFKDKDIHFRVVEDTLFVCP